MGRVDRFFARLLDRVRSIPGVEQAGAVTHLPLSGDTMTSSFVLEETLAAPGAPPHTPFSYVMPGYFETMGIRLTAGRTFTSRDTERSAPVVIVNETFASTYWPGQSALGRRLAFLTDGPPVWREVVGITGSVHRTTRNREPEAAFHLPVAQRPFALDSAFEITLVVRSQRPLEALLAPLRAALREVDPEQPLYDIRTLDEVMARSIATRELVRNVLGAFALAALLLAAVGIYGVMAYGAGERRREIGIRVALGARRRQVLALVLKEALRLTALGLAAGLLGALGLSQTLRGLLYQVTPVDPLTYLTTALILGAVAALASLLPAMRASAVDPTEALRTQ
jgi:predicted permease